MAAPAAALVLAALATLPCRGTDADSSTKAFDGAQARLERSQPTINKVYEMLRASPGVYNQTLGNSNYSSNLMSSFNAEDNEEGFNLTSHGGGDASNISVKDGAQVVVRRVALDMRGRKRAVSVVRAEAEAAEAAEAAEVAEVVPSPAAERRRRPADAGSSAPLLNYIFDAYSNTHHQHPRNDSVFKARFGGIYAAAAPELEALVGSTAHLDCKVDALHDKLVSWVRRKSDQEPMELLTTGTQQYTADDRYSARFIPPDTWRLQVRAVRPADAAFYDCQLSAHPPRTARVTLKVPEVSVRIVDGAGAAVTEQVVEEGSTAALRCVVRGLRMEGGPALLWRRRDALLNDDTTRGGISVRTELGARGAASTLRVARVRGADGGRYSCGVARAPPPAPPPAAVTLHVIKGESLAELHAGAARAARAPLLALAVALFATLY